MKSTIYHWNLAQKQVLLRIDANVPLEHGIILNDQRLLASRATLDLLLAKGAQVILLTHIGRPHNHEHELSTQHLLPWFLKRGYDISFAASIEEVKQHLVHGSKIVLLENLRFFKEEQAPTVSFAQTLASLASYYVNDAFGTLHRTDCSITLLPEQFDIDHKSIGLLVEHELAMLDQYNKKIHKPFVLIIGGGKVQDKIPFIEALLPKLSYILVGPGICFSFLKAEGKQTGRSLVDKHSINFCKDIIAESHHLNIPLYYPIDYIVAEQNYEGALDLIDTDYIPEHDVGISIGPKTAQLWAEKIIQAKTILINGLMGSLERPETLTYLQELFIAISYSNATSIIAGGDSVAAADYFKVAHTFSYISTGGGATLAYLCHQKLPGLVALKDRTKT